MDNSIGYFLLRRQIFKPRGSKEPEGKQSDPKAKSIPDGIQTFLNRYCSRGCSLNRNKQILIINKSYP